MSDDDHVLLTLPRGDRGEVRLCRSRYEGHVFTRIQLFYPADDGSLRPGRQCITIRDHELGGVIGALEKIAARIGPQVSPEGRRPAGRPRAPEPRGGGAQPGTALSDEELAELGGVV